jgi:uncharacterized membrane protein HdeD (DUF308 family)
MSTSSPAAGSGQPRPEPASDSDLLTRSWWVPLVAGILNLVAALIVLLEPHTSLLAIALVLGIYLLLVGISVMAAGLAADPRRWALVVLGALAVIAGIFVILRPGSAVHGVRVVFAIYLLISGALHLAVGASKDGDRANDVIRGVLELAAGILFLAAPKIGLTALALIVGIYLVLRGVLELMVALALREARRT